MKFIICFAAILGGALFAGCAASQSEMRPVDEVLKDFYAHQEKYNQGEEGPDDYLKLGAALASALKDEQLGELSTQELNDLDRELWEMLSDLANDDRKDRVLYDAARDMLQEYYDSHRPTSEPTPVPPQSNPRCPECNRT